MDKFTKRSKKILSIFSQAEGRRLNSDSIGPEHILLAIMKDDDSVASRILKNLGLRFTLLKKEIEQSIKKTGSTIILGNIPFNIRYNRIVEIAIDEAKKINNSYIGTEHLLLAIFKDGTCTGISSLKKLGIDYNIIKTEILKIIDQQKENSIAETEDKSSTPTLESFARNLTKMAINSELDPVIGREKEIDRVIRILSRKRKNNPVLIGEAGVGKTAIVEGLAQRIIDKKIPDLLQNKQVLALDLAAIVAGTKFRGEFEERIKKIMKEIKGTNEVIIFIDELHTIIGAGAAEGAIDAANILKPALSRGDLQCIGATTLDEYRRHIEKDAALERRFQTVLVEEPTTDETIEILRGLKERYESHHKVKYSDESLIKAVTCAHRYIHDRYLPDKAIDIIDEAGSKARLENCEKPEKLMKLEKEIEELDNKKNELVRTQEYEQAAAVRDTIKEKKTVLNNKTNDWQQKQNEYEIVVDSDDMATIISQSTGIPAERLNESDSQKLLRMEEELHKTIVGQDKAINVITKAIQRSRTGLKKSKGPIGSFVFLGPTGVGKTELAKSLSQFLFEDSDSLVRLDMSEYMERHSVSRLIGAPPGYVGYEGGGQLTERIKRKPYSVVLFDEIEKAHPDIFNILLQILEEGELTDSFGSTISFRDTIIILTSNIGSRDFHKIRKLGFSDESGPDNDSNERVSDELKRLFSPELLNRVDEVVYFHKLEKKHIKEILTIMLDEVTDNLLEHDIVLKYSKRVKTYLADKGYDEKFGARFLRKTITNEIEDPLAAALLEWRLKDQIKINIGIKNKSIYFKLVNPPKKDDPPKIEDDKKNENKKEEVSLKK